ncbi:MAG: acetyl-CoA carboxylase carboxyltransferase subunit alpha [Nitrospinota bacterium]
MSTAHLEFEEPIAVLESQIEQLRVNSKATGVDASYELRQLTKKVNKLRNETFKNLTSWQRTRLARHPNRPYMLDYIEYGFTDFIELHGDRTFSDSFAIIGGFAQLDGHKVMVVGQQKGRNTKERALRDFGMPQPEGYRKALRLFKLAEKFNLPLITFIDTFGAYPGVGAEERGQSEAIAKNLYEMSILKTPVIAVVLGEGGSGGALGLSVANRILMLEYSIYSVISPEGCASILWKSCEMVEKAADALKLTAHDLLELGIIDEIIKEPLGGAHRNKEQASSILRRALRRELGLLQKLPIDEIIAQRQDKFRKIGQVQ